MCRLSLYGPQVQMNWERPLPYPTLMRRSSKTSYYVTLDTSYYLFAQFFSLLLTHLHSITCVLPAQVFWMPLGPFEAQSSCPYFSESNRSQEKHFLYGRLADLILCLYSITQENNKTSLSREPINVYEIRIMPIWIASHLYVDDGTCSIEWLSCVCKLMRRISKADIVRVSAFIGVNGTGLKPETLVL